MFIKLMQVFNYQDDGWGCKTIEFRNPSWHEMETAVRRLEKFRYPFIWFYCSGDVSENALPDFEIMGGDGAYVVGAKTPDATDHRVVRFGPKSEKQIDVWLSDQGATFEEGLVCDDVDVVLEMLRQFHDSGTFRPGIEWE
jgi:hypothetical protein